MSSRHRGLGFETLEDRRLLATIPFPTSLRPVDPAGSQIYQRTTSEGISSTTDFDRFLISLDASQSATIVVDPSDRLRPFVELFDPEGTVLRSAESAVAGAPVVYESVAIETQGVYTLSIAGTEATTGVYSVELILNAGLDQERYGGAANDGPLSAQDLASAFQPFGPGTAERAGLVGTFSASDDDWYRFTLDDGQSMTLAVTGDDGAAASVEFHDGDGNLLARGTPRVNVGQAIESFVDATNDGTPQSYFVHLSGAEGDYSLVVMKDAELDLETNNRLDVAQDVSLTGAVLGAVTPEEALDRLFAYDASTNRIYEFFPNTGTVLRSFASPLNRFSSAYGMATTPTSILVGGRSIDDILELNPSTGRVSRELPNPGVVVRGIAYLGGEVFLLEASSRIIVLDYATGLVKRTFSTSPGQVFQSLGASSDQLFGIDGTNLVAIDPVTGVTTDLGTLPGTQTSLSRGLGIVGDEIFVMDGRDIEVYDLGILQQLGILQHLRSIETSLTDIEAIGGDGGGSTHDFFAVHANERDSLSIQLSVPAEGPYLFDNRLDPLLVLFDPAGAPLAQSTEGTLDHTAALTGAYIVRVGTTRDFGEYSLHVTGHTGSLPPFAVSSTDPADGTLFESPPSSLRVQLSDEVLLTSVEASDLMVDGTPALDVMVVDPLTLRFDLPPLVEGANNLAIAAGGLTDLQNQPIEAFSIQLGLDTTAPRVIETSIQQGETVSAGEPLVYTARFDEPLRDSTFDMGAVQLVGQRTGLHLPTAAALDLSGTTLSAHFDNLPEDNFRLTLLSEDGAFEDLIGHDLDGEATAFPIPPNRSGNGDPGGDFTVDFTTDFGTVPLPVPLEALTPLGSLIYQGGIEGAVGAVGDSDRFTIELEQGQLVTVVVQGAETLQAAVELSDPGGAAIGSGMASEAGGAAIIQSAVASAAGTYTLAVHGVGDTAGDYALRIMLNVGVEGEQHGGATNDTMATAEDLSGHFAPLGFGTAERAAVQGRLPRGPFLVGEDFESGSLGHDWFPSFVFGPGRIEVTDEAGAAGGSYALVMDQPFDEGPALNEVVWRVDLGGVTDPVLRFSHADFGDAEDPLPPSFRNSHPGDGVSVSEDGFDWYTVLSAADVPDGQWQEVQVDLAAVAEAEGIFFGDELYVKFQHFGESQIPLGGRGYDEIQISEAGETGDDWYRFALADGQSASLAFASSGPSVESLELYDSSGTRLAVGAPAENADLVVDSLVDATTDGGEDVYFARVAGNDSLYQLVVTRDAVFDTEPNDRVRVDAQDFTVSPVALGHMTGPQVFAFDRNSAMIVQLDLDRGSVVRTFPSPLNFAENPDLGMASTPTSLLVAGRYGARIFELDPTTGATIRELPHSVGSVSAMAFLENEIYLLGRPVLPPVDDHGANLEDSPEEITVIDYTTGDVIRTLSPSLDGEITGLAASTDRLFAALHSASLGALELVEIESATGMPTNLGVLDASLFSNQLGIVGDEIFIQTASETTSEIEVYNLTTLDRSRTLTVPGYFSAFGADGFGISGLDLYEVQVLTGDVVSVSTVLPGSMPGEFVNLLEAGLALYDPAGTRVASITGGSLTHTAAASGGYVVGVFPNNGMAGEYVLHVSGQTGPPSAFHVTASDPADGTTFAVLEPPGEIEIDFSHHVSLPSVQAADLTVDEVSATGVEVVDGNTLRFTLPPLSEGANNILIGGGAIHSLHHQPIEEFTSQIVLDVAGPRVVDTSIQEGGVVAAGESLVYSVLFDEVFSSSAQIDESLVRLVGQQSGPQVPTSIEYDSDLFSLTARFSPLAEDVYTLTLVSSDGGFEDIFGNELDGEPVAFPIPPNASGDGLPGGDFVVRFTADFDTTPYPVPLQAKPPAGSLIYDPIADGVIGEPGDVDRWTVDLDDGQQVTVVVEGEASLRPSVELLGPAGESLGTATANRAGGDAVIQAVPTAGPGNYTMAVAGADGSSGGYRLRLILGAAIEQEEHGGPPNDVMASAQDLDPSFLSLGFAAAERTAVLGTLPAALGRTIEREGFESGSLDSSWSTFSSDPSSQIHVAGQFGTAAGQFALLLQKEGTAVAGLNEAIWTVDLSGRAGAVLSFFHRELRDQLDPLPGDFTGHANGDGVAISGDGTSWHTVMTPPVSQPVGWHHYVVDLAAEAAAAGITLGADFQIKFQQYERAGVDSIGRGYDELTIHTPAPQEDWYRLTLEDGQSMSLALAAEDPAGVTVELYDSGSNRLASGMPAANADQVVSGFADATSDGTADAYFVRVTGEETTYQLVATRGAAFEIEPNNSPGADVQDITRHGTVLGAVSSLLSDCEKITFTIYSTAKWCSSSRRGNHGI